MEQIEVLYPCAFEKKLEYIHQLCQRESSPIAQHYMSLFSRTLSNIVQVAKNRSTQKTYLNEILCNRTEPLKPYNVPKCCCDLENFAREERSHTPETIKNVDLEQVRKALGFLVEHVNLWSISTAAHVLSEVINIVAATGISPSIFKGLLLRFISSNDVCMLHIVFKLKAAFGAELFSDEDHWKLQENLMAFLNQPSFGAGHRLLIFQWALHFPQSCAGFPPMKTCPLLPDEDNYVQLFPRVFDGPDTQLKKLTLLSIALQNEQDRASADESSTLLMQCLSLLQTLAGCGIGGKTLGSLLKALFRFNQENSSSVIQSKTTSLLVDMVMKHPKYSSQALRFVRALGKSNDNARPLSEDLLHGLLQNIQASDEILDSSELLHHLHVLQEAAKSLHIKPRDVLERLSVLLENGTLYEEGDWIVGSSALTVCRNILQVHNTKSVTVELGDVLSSLSKRFDNIEVQDRARFYYAIYTTLSSEKVSGMLSETSRVKVKDEEGLVNLTRSAGLSGLMPVVKLQTPILRLVRSQNQETSSSHDDLVSYSGNAEDYLHKAHNPTTSTKFTIPHSLQFMNGGEDFADLYAVVLKFDVDPNYSVIPDVHIPHLQRRSGQNPCNYQVDVAIEAKNPVPTTIPVQAVFTSQDSRTYVCGVGSVDVTFEDLALPFCVSSATRDALFEDLWDCFTLGQKSEECIESVEFLRLSRERLDELLGTTWAPLLVGDKEDSLELGMFLPPSWHLLLKLKPQADNTVITSLVTDNVNLLTLVSEYLHNLQNS